MSVRFSSLPSASRWAGPGSPSAAATPAVAPAVTPLATAPVQSAPGTVAGGYDGVVEAVRQTVVAAQVAGAVTAIEVKAGDSVKGRAIADAHRRPCGRADGPGERGAIASAQALLEVARKDYERQQQLFQQKFISQAALDQAESQFKASQGHKPTRCGPGQRDAQPVGPVRRRGPFQASSPTCRWRSATWPCRANRCSRSTSPARCAGRPQCRRTLPDNLRGAKVEFPALPAERRLGGPGADQLLPTVDAGTHPCSCASRRLRASPASRRGCSRASGCQARRPDHRSAVTTGRGRAASRRDDRRLRRRRQRCSQPAPGAARARRRRQRRDPGRRVGRRAGRARSAGGRQAALTRIMSTQTRASRAGSRPTSSRRRSRRCWRCSRCCSASSPCS